MSITLVGLPAGSGLAAGEGPLRMEEIFKGSTIYVASPLFAGKLPSGARWMKLDPEEALRSANRRWIERYARVEALATSRGLDLAELDLAGKDELWDAVKHGEQD